MTNSAHSTGPQLDDLGRRLRVWSYSSWTHGDRIAVTEEMLQRLADLGADAAGRPRTPVPSLGPHALGDQLEVLARQAVEDGADPAPLLAALAAALGFSPP